MPATLCPSRRSRSIATSSVTLRARQRESGTCGLPVSSAACASARVFPALAKSFSATSPVIDAATIPEPAIAVSNVIGTSSPALGERGPVTTRRPTAPASRACIAL